MAKRGQGEGTISKRPDGTWWARITLGKDDDGKQQRKAFYGKTRKEVQDKLTAALNAVNNDSYIEPSKMTVAQWMDIWLKEYRYMSVKPNTYIGYFSYAKNHIKPHLGECTLKGLRNDVIQKFVNKLVTGGLRAKTTTAIFVVLKMALDQAVENGLIAKNVAEKTKLPQATKPEIKVLTPEEQVRFIEASKSYYMGEAFVLILATGLRIGECLALTWDDVDFDKSELYVNKTQVKVADLHAEAPKWNIEYGTPKTRSSTRTIPLCSNAVQLLKQVKDGRTILIQEMGSGYSDNNLIFCTHVGTPIGTNSMRHKFESIAKKIGVEGLHIHGLRHTFATRGLENGIELKVMQELLGHSNLSMTADLYTHVLPDKKKESIMKLNDSIII